MRVRCTPVRGPAVCTGSWSIWARPTMSPSRDLSLWRLRQGAPARPTTMETSWSVLLWRPYTRLGLGEPISKAQAHRILDNPGGGRR